MKTSLLLLIAALWVAPAQRSNLVVAQESSAAESASKIVAETLDEVWADRPEGVDMLADILIKGGRMSGSDGWFRRSPTTTRFDWQHVRQTLDRDADHSISRKEFPGSDADFACLDRDGDGVVKEADFDFQSPPSPPSPAAILFSRVDSDTNGKITEEEFRAFFQRADNGGRGYLSRSDLEAALQARPPAPGPSSGAPTRAVLLKSFVRQELGAFPSGPSLNDPAPDFTLKQIDTGKDVTLSQVTGPKPVVLVFGDFTCGPFRGQAGNLAKLGEKYQDRATFLMVYIREPHPLDGWRMGHNDAAGVAVRQPRDFAERLSVAKVCNAKLDLGFPMLVDTMDDAVNNAYSGVPSRLYLIDRAGKVAFKSGRGPFGFDLGELEHSLVLLLQQEAGPGSPAGVPTPR
jgi:Ca2+-binding EF-hand superfamily protein